MDIKPQQNMLGPFVEMILPKNSKEYIWDMETVWSLLSTSALILCRAYFFEAHLLVKRSVSFFRILEIVVMMKSSIALICV